MLNGHPASQVVPVDRADLPSRAGPKFSPIACSLAFVAADLLSAVLAQLLTSGAMLMLSSGRMVKTPPAPDGVFAVTLILSVTILYLAFRGRYTTRTPFWSEASQLFSASAWAIAAQFLAGLLDHRTGANLSNIVMLALFPLIATIANALTKALLMQAGAWRLPVVLVGAGEAAVAVEAAIASDPSLGYSIVSRIDAQRLVTSSNRSYLWTVLEHHHAAQIVFAVDDDTAIQRQLINVALREKVPFSVAPGPHAMPALAWQATRFFSHDVVMLTFRHSMSRTVAQMAKTAIDVLAAALLLVLTSPIFLAAAIANLFSDGPLFFAHQRLGVGGQMFPCLKFRTMVTDGDRVLREALARDPALKAEWDATQKLRKDPRVTRFGRFLRETSLDELPQLINVIRRQMSLVGPRPIVQSEVRFYGDDIAHYYNTRPGVTGLWQVSGRSNTSYARRVQLDVWYVNNWSVWLDIAVLLKTVPAVLARTGAH